MSDYDILTWQTLIRPPLSCETPPIIPESTLKALACRNSHVSVAVMISGGMPENKVRLIYSDLVNDNNDKISARNFKKWLVGAVSTEEAGVISDPLYEKEEFSFDRCAVVYANLFVPRNTPAGTYKGTVSLVKNGDKLATNEVEVEVSNVVLPDPVDWKFFLNVWMNPATVARWHKDEIWSDAHFKHLQPYIEDLAKHGQKTVVVPISFQPWGTQTVDPYPNTVRTTFKDNRWDFDFEFFDRYVELHQSYNINKAIHCYSIVQGPGETDSCVISYIDGKTGEEKLLETHVGDSEWVQYWNAFFSAFRKHLTIKGWMARTYISFDEKTPPIMEKLFAFMSEYASDFKISLAGNTPEDNYCKLDDLSFAPPFNESGIAFSVPPERYVDMSNLLNSECTSCNKKRMRDSMITTFYVCCAPEFPNTFTFSPLVESRMLPWFAVQGGYDGFLRWAYNDWSPDPFEKPAFHPNGPIFPTGDTYFVYPGDDGPITSLRWEQLREGIQDYELAVIASENIQTPEEMVDFEQAVSLACRNVDGRTKSIGDIELARRLLIPIAEHAQQD